jgi:hydroxymethylpyrimidine/phosphomethylpyrimidine kinase
MENVVVDPVMVAKGGDRLLVDEAVKALKEKLIPLAYVLTPNIPEAEVLAAKKIETEEDLRSVARMLCSMGAKYVLMKGGHLKGPAVDTLFDGRGFETFSRPRVNTPHTHGTGCAYSAAIATFLGFGLDVRSAVSKAKSFIHSAIRFGIPLGTGRGPTNLFAPFAKEQARYCVLEELKTCAVNLQEARLGHLVPEVQSNLGYALPFAETCEDVAAFPGRLVRLHDKIASVGCPSFGASRHIATIILTMMRHDPTYRSAMNIRFSEKILKQCETLGWQVCFFDRFLEPKEIKQREGSTLEWGTETVLAREKDIPDIIFDRGDMGKEPMIRVLGRTPGEVVGKILRL